MKKHEFSIEGMKCEGCVNRINNVLAKIKGVKSYQVSLEDKSLVLEVSKDKVLDEVVTKIENLGFFLAEK